MRIAIVGYGKMGRMIERIAGERGHHIGLKLDEFNNAGFKGITAENFQGIDVAIDFSVPDAAVENIERIAALKVNQVIGTTGWLGRIDHVREVVEKTGFELIVPRSVPETPKPTKHELEILRKRIDVAGNLR